MFAIDKDVNDVVYASYMRALPYLDWGAPDSEKRHPEITSGLLNELAGEGLQSDERLVITGSKGKGSTARMVESVLRAHNLKTGMMTSPHIERFNERIEMCGKQIPDEKLHEYLRVIEPVIRRIDNETPKSWYVSPIAVQSAVSLMWFADESVDFAIFECGKGAMYDDVPSIPHKYSAVTPIFLEHTRELGDTISEIAYDKSHVITSGNRYAYIAKQRYDDAADALTLRASTLHVPIKEYGKDFKAVNTRTSREGTVCDIMLNGKTVSDVRLKMLSRAQAENCALALSICDDVLNGHMDDNAIRQALGTLKDDGRMQILRENPIVILDACINRCSCDDVVSSLTGIGVSRCTSVICVPYDKDEIGVAERMLEVSNRMLFTRTHNPHYKFSDNVMRRIRERYGASTEYVDDACTAIRKAVSFGEPVVALGTTSFISEIVFGISKL